MERPDEMVPVEVLGVRRQLPADEYVVLLLDSTSDLVVPIVIGPTEAAAIVAGQSGIVLPRPSTHDLLRDVLLLSGRRLACAVVENLDGGTFMGALVLDDGTHVDARPSDAIALAVRTGSEVLCHADVLAVAGVDLVRSSSDATIEQFRDFLEHVEADDFDAGEDAAGGKASP